MNNLIGISILPKQPLLLKKHTFESPLTPFIPDVEVKYDNDGVLLTKKELKEDVCKVPPKESIDFFKIEKSEILVPVQEMKVEVKKSLNEKIEEIKEEFKISGVKEIERISQSFELIITDALVYYI